MGVSVETRRLQSDNVVAGSHLPIQICGGTSGCRPGMSCSYIYSVCGSGAILNVPDMSTGLVVLGVQGCNEVTKYNNKRKCHSNRGLPTCLRARCPAIYLCNPNPTLPLRSASNRGRSHPVQHRTDLMTTSDHLLAAVPEFSSIRPTRLDLDALHQQQHTHKVPPEDHLLPRASPASRNQSSHRRLLCSPIITNSTLEISYRASPHIYVPLYGAMR